MAEQADRIGCRDECGASVADMAEAEAKAWEFLPIQKRYRCPDCRRALIAVDTIRNVEDSNGGS